MATLNDQIAAAHAGRRQCRMTSVSRLTVSSAWVMESPSLYRCPLATIPYYQTTTPPPWPPPLQQQPQQHSKIATQQAQASRSSMRPMLLLCDANACVCNQGKACQQQ